MALRFTRRDGEGFWIGDAFVRVTLRSTLAGTQQIGVSVTAEPSVSVLREELDDRPAPDVRPSHRTQECDRCESTGRVAPPALGGVVAPCPECSEGPDHG